MSRLPRTLGELRASGYRPRSVRDELRANLIGRIRSQTPLLPEMIGYSETVVPAIERAILAGHDLIFLGERGQGKSRMIRSLVDLLDDAIPVVGGSEIHDDPLTPVSRFALDRIQELGDETPVVWVDRADRYGEKLATPDVTIADLIGEIDPIRVAEGRYLADETTIHFGLIPRTNRGIFCINELPDLAEKVQVGLFNVLEERDFQIKGFKIRLPLDVLVVASANPEDYTRRGRIITPLKDRYQAQVRSHYPASRKVELEIMEQERTRLAEAPMAVFIPEWMKELIAELTLQARQSPDINQASGVSVRASIANFETVIASAERRALRLGESEAVPRLTDLPALLASMAGKLELEYAGADQGEGEIIGKLTRRAIKIVFDERLQLDDLEVTLAAFEEGWKVEVGDQMKAREYAEGLEQIPGLRPAIERLGCAGGEARIAAAVEFVLEGLHLSNRLNKDLRDGRALYG